MDIAWGLQGDTPDRCEKKKKVNSSTNDLSETTSSYSCRTEWQKKTAETSFCTILLVEHWPQTATDRWVGFARDVSVRTDCSFCSGAPYLSQWPTLRRAISSDLERLQKRERFWSWERGYVRQWILYCLSSASNSVFAHLDFQRHCTGSICHIKLPR